MSKWKRYEHKKVVKKVYRLQAESSYDCWSSRVNAIFKARRILDDIFFDSFFTGPVEIGMPKSKKVLTRR